MKSTPRILLVAHHCNPEWGSEPLIGWRWASHLNAIVPLTVVTHVRNAPAIARAGGLTDVRYVDTERLARRVNRINDALWPKASVVTRSLLESLSLRAFDREVTHIARDLIAADEIDLIHRVSPISPRAATSLGRLGVPLVLGPVNGGMETAPGFDDIARQERDTMLRLRSLARAADFRERTFRDASAILVANETTRRVLPSTERHRAVLLCENAVVPSAFTPRFERAGPGLSLLHLGRLLPYKGTEFLIRAMAEIDPSLGVRLETVGDGPEKPALKQLVNELALDDRVIIRDAIPVTDVPACMAAHDLFCLPSVRESGGAVLLEAMAAGTPVIAVDHGGPSETVVPQVGVLVRPDGPSSLVDALAREITSLAKDETRRLRLARAARRHVESHYSWDGKVDRARDLYEALTTRCDRDAS